MAALGPPGRPGSDGHATLGSVGGTAPLPTAQAPAQMHTSIAPVPTAFTVTAADGRSHTHSTGLAPHHPQNPPDHSGASQQPPPLPAGDGTSEPATQEQEEQQPPADQGTDATTLPLLPSIAPPTASQRSTNGKQAGGLPLAPVLLIAAGAAAAAWLLRRLLGGSKGSGRASSAIQGKDRKGATSGRKAGTTKKSRPAERPAPPPEPIDADGLPVLVAQILPEQQAAAAAAAAAAPSSLPRPLAKVRFTVSEDFDLAGLPTTLGAPHAVVRQEAAGSARPVERLAAAGAVCVGKASMQPLGLDVTGRNVGNPHNRAHVAGGGHTGSAMAVSTGAAELALASDMVGSARVPAACCGLYCYSSTPGALGAASGASAAAAAASAPAGSLPASLESLSIIGADPGVIQAAARELGAPGNANLRGDIIKFVVAEDLFRLCEVEYQPACLAVKRAILAWAHEEQAGAVQLCKFLADNSGGWQQVTPADAFTQAAAIPLPHGLANWATAALLLRDAHVRALLPDLAAAEPGVGGGSSGSGAAAPQEQEQGTADAATAAAAAGSAAADVGSGADAQTAASREESSKLDAAAAVAAPAHENGNGAASATVAAAGASAPGPLPAAPAPEALAAARSALRELRETLSSTVKPDTIIVMPVAPCAPPRRRCPPEQAAYWSALCSAFACLPALAQCPSVVIPLGYVADDTPLAVCLMACHKMDLRLLAVAGALGPKMQEQFAAVKQGFVQAAQRQRAEEEAAASGGDGAAGAATPAAAGAAAAGGGAAAPPLAAAAAAADPRRVERAERFKSRGNELFKAGKHADAFTEYSRAINEHPDNPIYYNNRAMACLKIFRFEQAEEDCNRALSFGLQPADKAKALLRRATARTALQKLPEAERDLRQVLSIEPNNRQAREDLATIRAQIAEMAQAQAKMVEDYRRQRGGPSGAGSVGAGGAPLDMGMMGPPGAGGMGGMGGFDPAAMMAAGMGDPSKLPPGFREAMIEAGLDPAMLAANPEALMQLHDAGEDE